MSRTIRCQHCRAPLMLVQDERIDRTGWACRDSLCPGYRYLWNPPASREEDADA